MDLVGAIVAVAFAILMAPLMVAGVASMTFTIVTDLIEQIREFRLPPK